MEKFSMATMTLPLVLADTGRKVSQTLRSTTMRKVRELGFTEGVRARFLARKAKDKVPGLRSPRVAQDTVEGSDQALVGHDEELLRLIVSVHLKKRERLPARLYR